MALTYFSRLFCVEYTKDLDVAGAYVRAGGKSKDPKNAGRNLFKRAEIRAEIERLMERRIERMELSQDRIIQELMKIAFADRTNISQLAEVPLLDSKGHKVTDEEGNVVTTQQIQMTTTNLLSEFERGAISGYKQTKKGMEVATYDKMKALELLGKHIGMFDDRLHVSGDLDQKVNLLGDILGQLKGDDKNE